jgi:hypothetical protein
VVGAEEGRPVGCGVGCDNGFPVECGACWPTGWVVAEADWLDCELPGWGTAAQ